jgi:hypothetical protein
MLSLLLEPEYRLIQVRVQEVLGQQRLVLGFADLACGSERIVIMGFVIFSVCNANVEEMKAVQKGLGVG